MKSAMPIWTWPARAPAAFGRSARWQCGVAARPKARLCIVSVSDRVAFGGRVPDPASGIALLLSAKGRGKHHRRRQPAKAAFIWLTRFLGNAAGGRIGAARGQRIVMAHQPVLHRVREYGQQAIQRCLTFPFDDTATGNPLVEPVREIAAALEYAGTRRIVSGPVRTHS